VCTQLFGKSKSAKSAEKYLAEIDSAKIFGYFLQKSFGRIWLKTLYKHWLGKIL
jgi:hypothetical protein